MYNHDISHIEGVYVCTFFGHSYCPESIKPKLYETLVDLIENQGVASFYVGSHGDFDRADIVMTYITHGWGGAAQFAELAEKRGKRMVKLGF